MIPVSWDAGGSRPPGLWLGARNTSSAAHYDSFHNLHLVIAGTKRVSLESPTLSTLRRYDIRPATHPEARQARVDRFPAANDAAFVTLEQGDAVFIPAGFVHRFATTTPAAAISWTALPREYSHFQRWMGDQIGEILPFMVADTARPKEWNVARFSASLAVFVTALFEKLGQPELLSDYVGRAYGKELRADLRLPSIGQRLPQRHFFGTEKGGTTACPVASDADFRAAREAAAIVTRRFKLNFRPALWPLYVQNYLDNIIGTLAGKNAKPPEGFAVGLIFLETCVLAS